MEFRYEVTTINFFWFSRALFGLSMGKEYESVDIRGLESVEMVCRRAEPEEATERKLEAVQILHCKYEEVRVMFCIDIFFLREGRQWFVWSMKYGEGEGAQIVFFSNFFLTFYYIMYIDKKKTCNVKTF